MLPRRRISHLLALSLPFLCSSWAPRATTKLTLTRISAVFTNSTTLGSAPISANVYEADRSVFQRNSVVVEASAFLSPGIVVEPSGTNDQSAVSVPAKTSSIAAEPRQEGLWNPVNKARLLLLAAAALYGTNFSLVKLMGQTGDIPVSFSTALRFGMAALATSPWLFGQNQQVSGDSDIQEEEWEASKIGFEVGMWNAVGYIAQAVGLETTLASKSAFLCSMAVVIVPILDRVFLGKELKAKQMVGLMLAIGGVGSLELADAFTSTGPLLSTGDLASMLQPIAFGIGFWRMEQAMHKYPNQANRSTAAQLLAVFLGSLAFFGIADVGNMDWGAVQEWLQDPMIWFALFWTGVVTTAMTVYMETLALKTLSAAETTLIFSSEPVSGAAFAAVVMGERFGPSAIVGSLLILSGCLFSNLGLPEINEKKDNQ